MPRAALAAQLHLLPGMLLHRPSVTGLFGLTCCFALAWRLSPDPLDASAQCPAAEAVDAPAKPAAAEAPARCLLPSRGVNVVDVAAGAATPELVTQLIRLEAGERVTSVDDHPAASDLAAGALIAARFHSETMAAGVPLLDPRGPLGPGDYLDVTIESEECSRRVLVLFH